MTSSATWRLKRPILNWHAAKSAAGNRCERAYLGLPRASTGVSSTCLATELHSIHVELRRRTACTDVRRRNVARVLHPARNIRSSAALRKIAGKFRAPAAERRIALPPRIRDGGAGDARQTLYTITVRTMRTMWRRKLNGRGDHKKASRPRIRRFLTL